MNRSWLAFRFFNVVSFVYNSWCANVNCDKMEAWVDAAKAPRGWRLSGIDAQAELEHRNEAI